MKSAATAKRASSTKRARHALRDTAAQVFQRTKQVIDSLSGFGRQAYWVWDFQQQIMAAGSENLAALYGYTQEEIDAMPGTWSAVVHPDDLKVMADMTKRLERAGTNRVVTCQVRIKRKDGKLEIVHVNQRPLERNAKGKLIATIGVSQIITNYIDSFDEIRRSEALYRQIVDEAGDGIFLFDAQGAIHFANRFAERMLGYIKGGLRGQSLWQVFKLPPRGPLPRDLRKLPRTKLPRVACAANRRDGKRLDVDLRVHRLSEDRFVGIARDVSREMAQAELSRQQAGYYRGLFRNNTSGVVEFDSDLRITAINPALASMLKRPERDLVGQRLPDFIAPEGASEAMMIFDEMRQDRRFNTRHRSGVQLRLQCKDGTTLLVQSALTAISSDTTLLARGIGIFTDITEEHRYRQERDEAARFNEALLQDAPVCIVVADAHGIILRVNPAFEELTGFRQREVVGKSGWDTGLLDDDQRQGSLGRFHELLGGASSTQSLLRIFTKKDGIRIVETHTTLTRSADGKPQRFIITGMDVTEQKRLEAEVINVAEQEQMRLGNDLHDGVGQTLTGILSLSEALESDLQGEAQRELGRIRQLVSDAVQQVRELSHGMTPGAVKHRGLGASLRLMLERLSSSRLQCECHCEFEPEFSNPDAATHLFRIAQEAVSNAIKHGRPKKISICLRRSNGNRGLMEIHDDGAGIKVSKAARAEGIGIRVMRYRIGLLGGTFSIANQQGGGTVVSCHFSCAL